MSMLARWGHAVRESAQLMRRRFATFALAALLCASALTLPLLAATIGYGLAPQAARLPIAPEVSVFAALSATSQDINALKAKLQATTGVERVQWITRDQSLADLARRSGGVSPLADLKPNPLPDTLIVTFRRDVSPDDLDRTSSEFRKLPKVDGVFVDSSWFRKAAGLARVMVRIALFVGLATLGLLGLVIIGAVRLIAMTDRDELRLLRLIGAEERQIARPFAYAGGITLLASTLLAVGAVTLFLRTLAPDLSWLEQVLGVPIVVETLPWPALAGLAAAAFFVGLAGASAGLRTALRRIA